MLKVRRCGVMCGVESEEVWCEEVWWGSEEVWCEEVWWGK